MKRLLIGLGVAVGLLLAAAVIAPFVIPVEQYKARIAAEVERRTGRALHIDGPIRLTVLPMLGVELHDVAFAGPPGAHSPDMVRLRQLELRLALWPLLRGEIEIGRFVLTEPVVALEIDARGTPNWAFASGAADTAPAAPATGAPGPAPGDAPDRTVATALRLGEVQVIDGTLSYFDARSGASYRIEDLDLSVRAPDLASPLEAEGTFRFRNREVAVALTLGRPAGLLEGDGSPLVLDVDAGGLAEIRFDGSLQPSGAAPRARGALAMSVPALAPLQDWLTGQGAGPLPVTALALEGQVDATPAGLGMSELDLALDELRALGTLSVALNGARPRITGDLELSHLDLDRFLPPPETAGPAPPAPAPGDPGSPGAPAEDGQGWSEEPIDLSVLRLADADLRLRLAGLTVRQVAAGATELALRLEEGHLTATLAETALYGGVVAGTLTADASGAVPALAVDLRLAGVQAEPVLTRFAGFDRLTGTAAADLALRTRGASQKDLVAALDGTGQVTFTDGAIRGINLAAMVRNVAGAFRDAARGTPQQTDFAELAARFEATDGVVQVPEIRLLAPLLRLSGGGLVTLPSRTVDVRLEPKLAATLEGQGGREQVAGVMVPILVRGTFGDLRFTPDLAGLAEEALRKPEAVETQVKELRDAIRQARPEEQLEGVLDRILNPPAEPGPSPAPAAPADAIEPLRGLFGR